MLTEENNNIFKLHPFELWLINQWRTNYRYGEITIIIQDGIPQMIKEVVTKRKPQDDGVKNI